MDRNKIDNKASLIWSIADKLQGDYKPHEYGEVILPFTVLKRFDCVLRDTKDKILKTASEYSVITPPVDKLLKSITGQGIYNISKYDFKTLLDDPDNINSNFKNYISGFSEDVTDIMEKFGLENQVERLNSDNLLYLVLQEFNSEKAELHPDKVSNIEMGYIFEEIIRKFSETYNADAGEFYTPREVIDLMVKLIFENEILIDDHKIISIYDGACGTGGMLSESFEYIKKLNNTNEVFCHGQELNPQTYAICKSDMLLKGQESYIKQGNTLSNDCFIEDYFDYIIMNPPFGREWKKAREKVEEEYKRGFKGRFGAGLPAITDSQLLFLQNAISKMNPNGSKIAIIHNGSALFNGDAESGPSNIRKYVLENDLLDTIIQLPNNIFYNTGITTYIWLLSNKKDAKRINKVQLIDASNMFVKRKKALGEKKNDITKNQIDNIVDIYSKFERSKNSKIFKIEEFKYKNITINYYKQEKASNFIIDKSKKNIENIPFNQKIDEYLDSIRIYEPDAFIDKDKIKIGYEIAFPKYFYKDTQHESSSKIIDNIIKLQRKNLENLKELKEHE